MPADKNKPGFTVTSISDGVSLLTENHVTSWLRCNIWHIKGRDRDLLIDSGMGLVPLKPAVMTLTDNDITAVSTHAHFDHIGGAHEFDCHLGHPADSDIHAHPTAQNTLAKDFVTAESITISPYDGFVVSEYKIKPAPLTGYIDDGDVIDLGNRVFKVLHLPGHAPGAISLLEEKTGTLFSGDVIYQGGLIDNAYHSDREQYELSLQRLKELPITTIHGGHEPSFGRDRMIEIIDGFLAGGERYDYIES